MTNETAEKTEQIDWEARALKAENKIVSMKQENKKAAPVEEKEETTIDEPVKEESNEETNTSTTQEEAIAAAVKTALEEQAINNNISNTNAMAVDGGEKTETGFSVITPSEYDNMSESAQADYMNKSIEQFGELELTFGE